MQSGQGRTDHSVPLCLTCPGRQTAGAFSVFGSDEQIFGANEQVAGGGCGLCPKNAPEPGNSVRASKKSSALPVTQSGRAEYRDVRPALLTAPAFNGRGLFASMASTNKSLVLMNKSIGQIAAPLVAEFVQKSAGLFKKEVIGTCV